MQKTNEDSLENILSAHANGLNQGTDIADWLLSKYADQYPELTTLLLIAKKLKQILYAVPMRQEAAAEIRAQLMGTPAVETIPSTARRRWVWWGAAAAGSVIAGVAGFLFWRHGKVEKQTATAAFK